MWDEVAHSRKTIRRGWLGNVTFHAEKDKREEAVAELRIPEHAEGGEHKLSPAFLVLDVFCSGVEVVEDVALDLDQFVTNGAHPVLWLPFCIVLSESMKP